MEERGHHLTIFDIHHKKPPSLAQITLELTDMKDHLTIFDIHHKKPPSLAQITLELTDMKDKLEPSDRAKIVDWIADGIKAQNDQWALNIISHLVFC